MDRSRCACGSVIKSALGVMGCTLVSFLLFGIFTAFTNGKSYGASDFCIPEWAFWGVFGWVFVYGVTANRSYHEINAGWYFPKLGWFSSLLLTAYLVLFGYLNYWISDMELGVERVIAAALVWVGYTAPFALFWLVIAVGHAKLMEKRTLLKKAGQGEGVAHQ